MLKYIFVLPPSPTVYSGRYLILETINFILIHKGHSWQPILIIIFRWHWSSWFNPTYVSLYVEVSAMILFCLTLHSDDFKGRNSDNIEDTQPC